MIAGVDGNRSVVCFMVDDGRIRRIDVVRNPDKLRRIQTAPGLATRPALPPQAGTIHV